MCLFQITVPTHAVTAVQLKAVPGVPGVRLVLSCRPVSAQPTASASVADKAKKTRVATVVGLLLCFDTCSLL